MPIVFIHGVGTRDDVNYRRGVGIRRRMFDELVVPTMRTRYPSFGVGDEVYWGDVGAKFAWDLRSVPGVSRLEELGGVTPDIDETQHLELIELLSQVIPVTTRASELETLGPTFQPLAAIAQRDPESVVRAVLQGEKTRIASLLDTDESNTSPDETREADVAEGEEPGREGERLAFLLLAAEDVTADATVAMRVGQATTDQAVLRIIRDETSTRFRTLESTSQLEELGASSWAWNRLDASVAAAQRVIRRARNATLRTGSLTLLQALRRSKGEQVARFFGDVFEYQRRGQVEGGIAQRVAAGVRKVVADSGSDFREPLVVVTHSFGSAIFYDLVTSGQLKDIPVDLWVMAGSQVSLFAEMRFFMSSPAGVPVNAGDVLGRPACVSKWLNVYDAADALSYLAAPVFGHGEVIDVAMQGGAHALNAHSAYFVEPSFYRHIASALEPLA